MNKPYNDIVCETFKIRTFEPSIDQSECVWHRDKKYRLITVLSGQGWYFQMDNEVPYELKVGDTLKITKETYHRIFKVGSNVLKIKIEE